MLTAAVPTAVLTHAANAEAGGPGLFPLFLIALPVLLGAALLSRSRDPVTSAVCLFSAGAGAIHAIVTPEHLQEDVRFGAFFLVVTVLQLAWIVPVLRRSSTATWVMGGAGNLAVLAIWGASRSTGLPIGPHPWMTEPVGMLDLACGAYEVGIVAGCLWLARAAHAPTGRAVAAL
jgi:hypothetical protein